MEQRVAAGRRVASAGSLAATGAAFAVGIGYMDPGNWATDLDATRYGYALLWSVLLSGLAAVLLQVLVVRHAAGSGEHLAAAIARRWPRVATGLWPLYALLLASQVALGLILPTVVVPLIALVAGDALHRTRVGLILLASTTTVVAAALLCDGVLITSVFAHA